MLFSVIVPVYKVEKYIRQCIESILQQTYIDFQLILVDDGSPDGCPTICDEYADRDSRVEVIHKANGGLTSARKAGLALAKGEYILCVDGDDCIAPNLLFEMNKIISESQCDIICFGYDTFPNNARKNDTINYREGKYNKEQIEKEIFPTLITGESGLRFPPSIWSKVFKRELLAPVQNDLPNEIIIGEDSCISYVLLFQAESIYVSHEAFYHYRVENMSLTRSKKAFSWSEPLLRANFYLKYMPKDKFEEQVARITAHSYFNVAMSVLRAKKYGEAKKEIAEKLSDENAQYFLKMAKFNNKKEQLALYCLRKKRVLLMKILSKVA